MKIELQADAVDVVRDGKGGFTLYLRGVADAGAHLVLRVSPERAGADVFAALEAAVSAEWEWPRPVALADEPGYDANGSPVP